jgi:cytochrome P450
MASMLNQETKTLATERLEGLARIKDYDDPNYDPFLDDELMFGANPDTHERIAELRKKGPVIEGDYYAIMGLPANINQPTDLKHFTVLSHKEAYTALTSPNIFTNAAYQFSIALGFGRSISTMDAPEHTRYRRIFQKVFLPQVIAGWGDSIVAPVVNELMDAFVDDGKADLVDQFTHHYPFGVIYRQLELPSGDGAIFHKLAVGQLSVGIDWEHGREAVDKLGEYFSELIRVRRATPGNDLVSLLVQAEVDGEYIPDEILISFFRQLINAAGDTTFRATSVLLANLLENPDQLEALRNDRSLMAGAIEEGLRFDGPVVDTVRMTSVDTELSGVKIPAGAMVHVIGSAANRDPEVFPNPDRFDIMRMNKGRHLSFAAGPHLCIGMHLARLEMTRAVNAILDRLPKMRLDPDMPKPRTLGATMRYPRHIYVRFD